MSEKIETQKNDTRKEVAEKFRIPECKLKYIKKIQEVKPEVIPQILAGKKKMIKDHLDKTDIFDCP